MASTKMKTNNAETFDLNDKVEYKDFAQDNIPEDIIFPEELNRFLRDQIRELTAENGCLRRGLEESENKLLNLSKNLPPTTETPTQASVVRASEIAASKIVELSKKLREQTAEIEGLRSRCKKLESKLNDKENNKVEEIETVAPSGEGPLTIEDELKNREDEIKSLNDKIYQINSKLYDSKNTCTSLRNELNKAHKLLCREVGENVTIASLTSQQVQTGWRGRAEQIRHLQSKLNEYEGSIVSRGSSSATILEKRNITNLRNIEKERRLKAEESAREFQQMNLALENCKRKQDAARARVKVLENDLNTAKQSIVLLNEKKSHDDQLIQALNGQLKAVEDKFRDREREILGLKDRSENECMRLCSEITKLKTSNDNLRRTIDERETEIDSMRSNGDYNEYVTLGIAAEAERERLLELVIVLNRRLDDERFATDKIAETLRIERNKLARLETKLQRLEMERVGMSKVNSGYKPKSSKLTTIYGSTGSAEEGNGPKDDIRFRLELLEEECLALKTRLATVQRDKSSDLAMYKQMLDQARKTFQDAYRGKPSSCSHSSATI